MGEISILFLFFSLLAEIIGTIGGFGSSVFFVPIANFYFDFQSVLGLTAIYHLASNVSKIFLFRHGLDKRLLILIGIPSVVFVILGGLLTKYIAAEYLEISLAVFLIVISLVFLIKKDLSIVPIRKNAIIGGCLSGFSAGLLGTGGAIRGLTMAAFNLEKNIFVATSAGIDLMIDSTRSFVYFQNGYMQSLNLNYVLFLLIIGFVGTWIGRKILQRIPQEKFKTISLSLILLIGMITFLKVLFQ